ncbi:MAG: metallophosphoesterase [bacterium]|nr:metallophosphoesterase [bacterium]
MKRNRYFLFITLFFLPSVSFAGEGNIVILGLFSLIYFFGSFLALVALFAAAIFWHVKNKDKLRFSSFFKSRMFLILSGLFVGGIFLEFVGLGILYKILVSIYGKDEPSMLVILGIWAVMNLLVYGILIVPTLYFKRKEPGTKGAVMKVIAIPFVIIAAWILLVSAFNLYYLFLGKAVKEKNVTESCENLLADAQEKISGMMSDNLDSPQRVVIYGDSRTGIDTHKKIISLIMKARPEAVFNVGDIVEDGRKPEEWPVFNEITKDLRANTNFYPVLGNHEEDSPLFYNNFELPGNEQWYSINFNKIHFTVLNSNKDLSVGSEQYKWLENDLANVGKDIRFKVVTFHHPPFSSGKHGGDEISSDLQKSVVPLFEKYKVSAVFNGHDHDYERSEVNGISYFVTGGGGAPLYPPVRKNEVSKKFEMAYHYSVLERTKNALKVSVYDVDDKLIDEASIK